MIIASRACTPGELADINRFSAEFNNGRSALSTQKTTDGYWLHGLVLPISVLVAVAIWLFWLLGGMDCVHRIILTRLVPVTTTTSAINEPTDTSGKILGTLPSNKERETIFTELGQTGDAFGGLNALLTAIAGALVFWAGFMQHQTLKQARKEAKSERDHRQIQEFESLLFRLLELTATAVERIQGPKLMDGFGQTLPRHKGTRALDSYAHLLFTSIGIGEEDTKESQKLLATLVKGYLTKVYDRQPSAFGPYLRLLYQTFKHIAESDLSEEQQIRYANIARGQISDGAVLLLALNGLTPNGYKFAPLVERFGLLEHMYRRYRAKYEAALGIGYRPRAFLGSQERAKPGNKWHETPLLNQAHFKDLETAREAADGDDDFDEGYTSQTE